ncbi:phosphate--AMP phosphotransferase [Christensenellaceae bacterium OttesenSCG-928-K19]|nr:phosphate--AMP phosphotransferase [Christensenellaceae bacterium OttesenSCG-928-K19]
MKKQDCTKISRKEMAATLTLLQQKAIAAKLPVIVLFEGFSTAGKGAAISSLILNFDPRGFDVYTTRVPEKHEKRKPWLARFAQNMPAYGRFAIFDRAWYSGMTQIQHNIKKPGRWQSYLEDINTFERQLHDDGYLILKFFLRISKKEQEKRIKKLLSNKNTAWRVSQNDLKNLKHFKEIDMFYREMLAVTDRPYAKWHEIDAKSRKNVRYCVYNTVVYALEQALKEREVKKSSSESFVPQKPYINIRYRMNPTQKIKDADLTLHMEREQYDQQLRILQRKLSGLHNSIYRKNIPVILCFEGNDAAGKGGAIKRLARALDPRGYTVCPTGAPTPEERSHQFLWRFWNKIPKSGHITIFDRTWYGRVLVEHVESLTPKDRILQAYNEINEFEYMLHEWGALVLKFWLAIDKDEQLLRFEERQNIPEKQWKITDEDWRNREKWDAYAAAVDTMLEYTDSEFAPWTVVEANCKLHARIKVLDTVARALERVCF